MIGNIGSQSDKLLLITAGGANEIGVNLNLYHYDGRWIAIDCGSGFAGPDMPGVDMIVSEIPHFEKHIKEIDGLVITHLHEDHVGAIQHLYKKYFKCPIYTTRITANFLKLRLMEHGLENVEIVIVDSFEKFEIGPFNLELFPLAHSAPEMHAVMLRTPKGNVVHTGDWKFDSDPIVGTPTSDAVLAKYGEEGVLALVCDSTNVFNKEEAGSEGDLKKSLVEIIRSCENMIVVTTFASNLARLEGICHAARLAGRKICLTGRSINRIYNAARESGYMIDISPNELIDEKDVHAFKRREILIISTGCQGEPMAGVAKMANNTHNIKLHDGDTIIFSSKIIPGNEKKIFNLYNLFVRRGIDVITEHDRFVHVSGHPGKKALTRMYDLLKPKIAIPVHGEPMHIHEHVRFAKTLGVQYAIEVENGSIVNIDQYAPSLLDKIDTGYFGVDGKTLISSKSYIFPARIRMRDNGIVVSTIIYLDSRLLGSNVTCIGCFEYEGGFISSINDKIRSNAALKDISESSIENVKKYAKSIIRKMLISKTKKNPLIVINVESISPNDMGSKNSFKKTANKNIDIEEVLE